MLWVGVTNSKFPRDSEPDLEGCSPGTRIPQGVCGGKCEDQEGHPSSLTGRRKGQKQSLTSLPTGPYPELQIKGTSDGPSSPSWPLPTVSSAPAITVSHTCLELPLATSRPLLVTSAPCPSVPILLITVAGLSL